MYENDVDYMTSAYRMLYEIETMLKSHVHSTLFKLYGCQWEDRQEIKKPLNQMYYFEVIRLYKTHPLFNTLLDNHEYNLLHNLRHIRNDVAHMNILTSNEYDLLTKCNDIIKNRIQPKEISNT